MTDLQSHSMQYCTVAFNEFDLAYFRSVLDNDVV